MLPQLAMGVIMFAPAMVALYVFIGRHDEHFRHEAMFLVLLVGLGLGLVTGLAELFVLTDASLVVVVLALPMIETMAKTMVVGLPRFRGNEETVFLGGATGLSLAAMVLMTYGQVVRDQPVSWQLLVTLVTVAVGFTLVQFVSGMLLGRGPAEGSILARFVPAYGLLLPAHVLLMLVGLTTEGCTGGLEVCVKPLVGYVDVEWGLLLAAYGVALTWTMAPGLLRRGLPPEERARLRREKLARARGET